ncbi:MAG TPA: acyl carrier protein [Candidatus Binataceae bacterium]
MPEEMNAPEAAAAENDELTQKVLRIVADTQRKDVSLVRIDSSFEELGIDSIDGVNIVFALENEFDVNVPDDEVKNIRSIRDMVEGIRKLVAARAAGAGEAAPA